MTKRDRSVLLAERLRAVTSMPEYEDTIGRWIEDIHQEALHEMSTAKDQVQFHQSQGAYRTITSLIDRIAATFSAEKAAVAKNQKKMQESYDDRADYTPRD